ncbi:MAG: hypothetical protein ACFFDW_04570, partial [Candidatus Thorarchaeota archaeon]
TYVSDEGFGAGITESTLVDAPLKAVGFGLGRARGLEFLGFTGMVPLVHAAWVDPTGLTKTDTIIDMNLTNIMPSFSSISGHDDSTLSIITMKLPYIVDVLAIDPPTNNSYAHLKGNFEWVVKVDFGIIQSEKIYDDIYVSYNLNISELRHYPQIQGELSLNSSLPLMGGSDIEYVFEWENVGDETAYDISLQYGGFNSETIEGMTFPINNPELTFYDAQTMYYDADAEMLYDYNPGAGNIFTIEGWFYNETAFDWLYNGESVLGEDLTNLNEYAYLNDTFLQLDPGDFSLIQLEDDSWTLESEISELASGENASKSFTIKNLPTGSWTIYNYTLNESTKIIDAYIVDTVNWDELIIFYLRMLGSSLHIPEDQVTYTNWFPTAVEGAPYYYFDENGKQFAGITNGLVIQLYDNEAVLVGKTTLDKDVYRFDEPVTMSLELTNIGDANATNVTFDFFHAFVNEQYELQYVDLIEGSHGVVPLIKPGETYIANYTTTATTNVGLHPVYAVFGYTSEENEIDSRDDPANIPDIIIETLIAESPGALLLIPAAYNNPIFNTTRHSRVVSSMDFGMVLPPLNKEGTTRPIYPTPEVEVSSEILGLTNETRIGDTIILRTIITNVGDEATNIIYSQWLPTSQVMPSANLEDYNITVNGIQITEFTAGFINNPRFGYGVGVIAQTVVGIRGVLGIPLGVNETMIIEAPLIVKGTGEVFIPPAEIRYNSRYNMTSTISIEDERSEDASTTIEAQTSKLAKIVFGTSFTIEEVPSAPITETNSWGSYSESLTLVIQSILGLNYSYIYIGVGLIAVTGVAVLIYFRGNGKKH